MTSAKRTRSALRTTILLVDFAYQGKREGLATCEALLRTGRIRLRPILMTAVSLIVGMIPIALAMGLPPSGRSVIENHELIIQR